jgi:hypothetical protein
MTQGSVAPNQLNTLRDSYIILMLTTVSPSDSGLLCLLIAWCSLLPHIWSHSEEWWQGSAGLITVSSWHEKWMLFKEWVSATRTRSFSVASTIVGQWTQTSITFIYLRNHLFLRLILMLSSLCSVLVVTVLKAPTNEQNFISTLHCKPPSTKSNINNNKIVELSTTGN